MTTKNIWQIWWGGGKGEQLVKEYNGRQESGVGHQILTCTITILANSQ